MTGKQGTERKSPCDSLPRAWGILNIWSLCMSDELIPQSIIDEEHLKLLSLGYMISAATTAFFSMFGLMYAVMGLVMGAFISHQQAGSTDTAQAPPAFVGWLLTGIGTAIFLLLVILAAAKLRAALCIKRRKSRTFCMVVAGFSCLAIPWGTALGVLSFIVLGRDSVARLFKRSVAPGFNS